jgi:hypothetical protein
MKSLEFIEKCIGWIVKVVLISLYTFMGIIMLVVLSSLVYGLIIELIKALR